MPPLTIEEKFDSRTEIQSDGCILWIGGKFSDGYGQVWYEGRSHLAHRIAWILANGPIPDGFCVLHRCDIRNCVNIEHLFLGTNADNSADMVAKERQFRPIGEIHQGSKLKESDVLKIRQLYGQGKYDQLDLAIMFEVSSLTISAIINRKTWKHI